MELEIKCLAVRFREAEKNFKTKQRMYIATEKKKTSQKPTACHYCNATDRFCSLLAGHY